MSVSPAPSLRRRCYELLEGDGRPAQITAILLTVLIVTSVAATVLESTAADPAAPGMIYVAIEWLSAGLFSVEYLLRLWIAPESPHWPRGFARLRWSVTPLALVDLLAVLPFWWNLLVGGASDLRVIRLLRVLRLLRLAKLGRHSQALHSLGEAFWSRRAELVIAVVVLTTMLLIASTLMYHIEHEANPETFSSIPAAMWWGIATLTTVGYGDVVPGTGLGKVLGALIAVLGIGVFALPAGILTAALQDAMAKTRRRETRETGVCPTCGRAGMAHPLPGPDSSPDGSR